MRRTAFVIGFGGFLAFLLALDADQALAQKKDKKGEPKDSITPATPADYLQLQNRKEIIGKIVGMGVDGKSVQLRIDFPHWEPNPNYKAPAPGKGGKGGDPLVNQQMQIMKRYQDLMRQMEQAKKAKTPIEQQRIMQRVQIEMVKLQMQMQQMYMYPKDGKAPGTNPNNQPFRLANSSKDYELELQEGVVIRKMFLPFEYDDVGAVKKYSDKELAELRGTDKTKPGYIARLEEMIPGTEARMFLAPTKPRKKGDDEGVGNVDRPVVTMIVLTKESTVPPITSPDPGKKKKDKK